MDNLIKVYNKRKVVDGASFNIKKGEVVGLLGPNGAGKTTSFYMSVGFVKPDSGKVYIDGQDVTESPMHIRARLGVGYLAQEASIFRKLTVAENLEAILETMNLSRTEIIKRRDELLIELQIMRVAIKKVVLFRVGKGGVVRLQEHLSPIRTSFFWTSRLRVWIRSQ